MPNSINNIYENYKKELEQIIKNKHLEKIQELLNFWLAELCYWYNEERDLLNHQSLDEYIKSYFQALKNVNNVQSFQIEEILVDRENYFYKLIDNPVYDFTKFTSPFRFKKVDGEYIIDENGDYFLNTAGCCDRNAKDIKLVSRRKDETALDFHHELTHSRQELQKFIYHSIFPYASLITKTLIEGEAVYHEYLLGRTIKFGYNWDEENINVLSYDNFLQLYIILMLILPDSFKNKWENGKFDVALIPQENFELYVDVFALITYLSIWANGKYQENITNVSINNCYNDCRIHLEIINSQNNINYQKEEIRKDLKKRQVYLESILLNRELLEQEYQKEYSEISKEYEELETEEERKEFSKYLEQCTLEAYRKEREEELRAIEKQLRKEEQMMIEKQHEIILQGNYSTLNLKPKLHYEFGLMLSTKLKELINDRKSISDAFHDLLEKSIYLLLQEREVNYEAVMMINRMAARELKTDTIKK